MTPQFLTPKKQISRLGSAKSGTHHFWLQRLTAIANLVLSIGLICIVLSIVGKPYAEAVTIIKQPFVTLILLAFTLSVTTHMRLGLQIVIEDYVHNHVTKTLMIIFNIFFTYSVMLVAGFSILKLAFMN